MRRKRNSKKKKRKYLNCGGRKKRKYCSNILITIAIIYMLNAIIIWTNANNHSNILHTQNITLNNVKNESTKEKRNRQFFAQQNNPIPLFFLLIDAFLAHQAVFLIEAFYAF